MEIQKNPRVEILVLELVAGPNDTGGNGYARGTITRQAKVLR